MSASIPSHLSAEQLAESLSAESPALSSVMYSFRCSAAMNATLQRLTSGLGLNRTSVIRLSLHLLDCYTRQQEVQRMSLAQLLQSINALAEDSTQA